MGECGLAGACAFLKAEGRDERWDRLKKQYCASGGVGCARRSVAGRIGEERLPYDLLPNDTERAYDLIREPALLVSRGANGTRRLSREVIRA